MNKHEHITYIQLFKLTEFVKHNSFTLWPQPYSCTTIWKWYRNMCQYLKKCLSVLCMSYQKREISNTALFKFTFLKRNIYISKFPSVYVCCAVHNWLEFFSSSSFLHLKLHSKLYKKFQSEHLNSTNMFSVNESYLGIKTPCPKNHFLHCQILHLIQRHLPAKNLSITGAPKKQADRLQVLHPHKARYKKHRFCTLTSKVLHDLCFILHQPLKSNDG